MATEKALDLGGVIGNEIVDFPAGHFGAEGFGEGDGRVAGVFATVSRRLVNATQEGTDAVSVHCCLLNCRDVVEDFSEPLRSQLGSRHLGHKGDEACDGGRIGSSAEADDEASRAALAKVVEQGEGQGSSELLLFHSSVRFPRGWLRVRELRLDFRKREVAIHMIDAIGQVWLEAAGAGAAHSRGVDIDDCRGELHGLEREARSGGEQASGRSNQGAAIIDCPARFVAQEVGGDVADSEGPGAFDDKPFANFELAEGEVTGTWVEDDVDAGECHIATGPLGYPGIFTDFQADLHSTAVEGNVTDRILFVVDLDGVADADGPRFEPSWFVVQAFACEKSFCHEAENLAVCGKAGGVEKATLVKQGYTNGDDHVARFVHDFLENLQRGLLQAQGMEHVLASVTGNGHFGKAEDAYVLASSLLDGIEDICEVVFPVERCLVENGCGDANSGHVEFLRAASIKSSFF